MGLRLDAQRSHLCLSSLSQVCGICLFDPRPSVFLIRRASETGSLSPTALAFSAFVSFSPDYQCH